MKKIKTVSNIIRNQVDKTITLQDGKSMYSLLWLHGLAGEAEQYVSFFSHSDSAVYNGCRIKLLQAPKRFVEIRGAEEYSWYDIRSKNRFTEPEEKVFNLQHIQQTKQLILTHFMSQMNYWKANNPSDSLPPQKRIYIGGMSQGGVMALQFGLSSAIPPAGVISFSSYLLKLTKLKNLDQTSFLIVHGNRDTTIPEVHARKSYQQIIASKTVEYHTIKKLDHSVCLEQIKLINSWTASNHQRLNSIA